MKCLWVTLADPDPPRNGQFLYSRSLIHGLSSVGMDVHVVGLARPRGQHRSGESSDGVHWWLADHRWSAEHQPSPRWVSLASLLPQLAAQTNTPPLRRLLHEHLADQSWDAVVFDSICIGWALSMVVDHYAGASKRPKLVYLSHNHEETVAKQIADDTRPFLKRQFKRFDAAKVRRLERWLVRRADLVTSNSPDDCEKFRPTRPDRRVEFLPPSYDGRRVTERRITADLPRRAIIVGSFDWVAKRLSLEEFLAVADPLFEAAGVELYVVGSAADSFLRDLRGRVRATRLTGRVDDIGRYMDQARLALVPDLLGGFKLKALDYVFNRLPIFAMAGSVPGMPLLDGESICLFNSHRALAEGVIRAIDDIQLLNRIQNLAYAASSDQFDKAAIGRRLLRAMSLTGSARPEPVVATTISWPTAPKVGSLDSPA
ncbi:MAG TPA: glycosyltransferase [Alphaproteobacteria bacterium]